MRVAGAWAVVAALAAVGCGGGTGAGPPTYPVSGEVFRGGKPAAGGTVQFVHQTEPDVRAVGEIGPDGKFSLFTMAGAEKRTGAVAGEYKAVLVFTANDPPFHPKTVFRVEPRENAFKIELP
ncbi:MAG: hypothetical protein J0I06_10465 [Planctomycetes bacterium]|nr:hypothetical protein [Planctomycetota bacterium]